MKRGSRALTRDNDDEGNREGEVVAAFGRHFRVDPGMGESVIHAVTRGRRGDVACGDRVVWQPTSPGEGVIERVLERRNLVYRSDQYRQKLLAANVDRIAIVVAVEPSFSLDLLSRALVAAESADVPALVVFNKVELNGLDEARARLAFVAALGYPVVEVSLRASPHDASTALTPYFQNATTVVIGQSGMGKSTLVNLLVPEARIATQEISSKLDSGKHTTTSARIHMHGDIRIVDSPGFQEFGLAHLDQRTLENAFVEFRAHLGGCRFHNCRHLEEPHCAITQAAAQGEISAQRLELYRQLYRELKQHLPHYA
ncbi:MAG TPA: ribosome small subunit-dependent GTPase A [Burkholderiaceae bacterium]|nr:ribosome small subunit-dependent GTPase A [Burkholderiaceae bacterium]